MRRASIGGGNQARLRAACVLALLPACSSTEHVNRSSVDSELEDAGARVQVGVPAQASLGQAAQAEVLRLLQGDLDEVSAIQIALLNDRRLLQALEHVGVARAEWIQAGLLSNPVFDVEARFYQPGSEIEATLIQPLVELFLRSSRRNEAQAHLDSVELHLIQEIVDHVFSVRRAYLSVALAQLEVETRQQILEGTKSTLDLTLALHEAGNLPQKDLSEALAEEASMRLDLDDAERNLAEAREDLHGELGLYGEAIQRELAVPRIVEAPRAQDWSGVESRAIASSLDLGIQWAEMNALTQRADLAAPESLWSELALGVTSGYDSGDGWSVGPALSIPIPIFDDGSAREAAAQAEFRASLAEYWSTAVEIRSAARRLRDRCRSLGQRLRYMELVYLPRRAAVVKETLKYYNAMQIGAFEVLEARRGEMQAKLEVLATKKALHKARLSIEELLAGNLSRDRMQPIELSRTSMTEAQREQH